MNVFNCASPYLRMSCPLIRTYLDFLTVCREILTEVFHRLDLNSSGALSRTEFDFFQERSSSDVCDDETWNVVKGRSEHLVSFLNQC